MNWLHIYGFHDLFNFERKIIYLWYLEEFKMSDIL
jgi:hypothetical protein